jgi:hypothetical protein
MNEHIRLKVVRGKLADIKRNGSNTLNIPAILQAEKAKRNRRKGRKYGSD